MIYRKSIILKNGKMALLRNGDEPDGLEVYDVFNRTHAETDYLLAYPDENCFDPEKEAKFLSDKTKSPNEMELVAIVDDKIVGIGGFEAIGTIHKLRHRADFGVCILQEYWGLGIGKAITEASIECARNAGFVQLELNVVADNKWAVEMYRAMGFVEFGRNPRGFESRISGYQEVIYMYKTL
ncbi:sortase-like acyltransferase [Lachnospiraceae bacterium JC7]|nr:sortase-like acyltransferase [Lachnospiraceae bacterium JC7]